MAVNLRDLGNLPGQERLYLALAEEEEVASVFKRVSAVKRSLVILARDYPGAPAKEVCAVRDGDVVIEPAPGTDGLPDAERLALKAMPASYGMRRDFPALLKDPLWQSALDLLVVDHVMGS